MCVSLRKTVHGIVSTYELNMHRSEEALAYFSGCFCLLERVSHFRPRLSYLVKCVSLLSLRFTSLSALKAEIVLDDGSLLSRGYLLKH